MQWILGVYFQMLAVISGLIWNTFLVEESFLNTPFVFVTVIASPKEDKMPELWPSKFIFSTGIINQLWAVGDNALPE